jgi:hypothetical protein
LFILLSGEQASCDSVPAENLGNLFRRDVIVGIYGENSVFYPAFFPEDKHPETFREVGGNYVINRIVLFFAGEVVEGKGKNVPSLRRE